MTTTHEPSSELGTRHLFDPAWRAINVQLVAKAISELAHELVLEPQRIGEEAGWGQYVLAADDPAVEYRFNARVQSLDHWQLDERSLRKVRQGAVRGEKDARLTSRVKRSILPSPSGTLATIR